MSRFNLINEPWIRVIVDGNGTSKLVSLKELFKSSHDFLDLAGDTKTQDFAVFRVLLAILHTVFSRYDFEGNPYSYLKINDRMQVIEDVHNDDLETHVENLSETWGNLWHNGRFPNILQKYLDTWYDHFYLYDEKYPFFQVTQEDISEKHLNKKNASKVTGKNINRQISESGNKVALFSPKYDVNKNKEYLTDSEVARWLLTFHGYTGLSDKVIFGMEKYKASKGWLFDIGGLFIKGDNLYQTLILNLVLINSFNEAESIGRIEKPCWEFSSKEIIEKHFQYDRPNNLAELYTNWSRAIYIDPETELSEPFEFEIVKLPDIAHEDMFIEPMTIWRFNKNGPSKEKFTPKKHPINQSMWRSYGLIANTNSGETMSRIPGIIEWINRLKENDLIGDMKFSLVAISMQDDGNATSWVPVDEIYDNLDMNDILLTDMSDSGWVVRLNETIDTTKTVIEKNYRLFLADLNQIRNIKTNNFINQKIEEFYFEIDQPFREWIGSINQHTNINDKIIEWFDLLKKLILIQANKLLYQSNSRDLKGIVIDGKTKNIITAYSNFEYHINRRLK